MVLEHSPATRLVSQGPGSWLQTTSNSGESSCSEDGAQKSFCIISKTLRLHSSTCWRWSPQQPCRYTRLRKNSNSCNDAFRTAKHPLKLYAPAAGYARRLCGFRTPRTSGRESSRCHNFKHVSRWQYHCTLIYKLDIHPKRRRTRCGWPFGKNQAEYRVCESLNNAPIHLSAFPAGAPLTLSPALQAAEFRFRPTNPARLTQVGHNCMAVGPTSQNGTKSWHPWMPTVNSVGNRDATRRPTEKSAHFAVWWADGEITY